MLHCLHNRLLNLQNRRSRLVIPSGKVTANLTDLPIYVRLSDMPYNFWNHVGYAGEDIRVYNSFGVALPVDVVRINRGNRTGHMFFKSSLLTAADNVFTIEVGNKILLPVTDILGRNNVWVDYEVCYLLANDLVDRTGNHDLTTAVGTPEYAEITGGAGGGMTITADYSARIANALATGTTFTMAATGTFSTAGGINYPWTGYLPTIGSVTGRAHLGMRNTGSALTNYDETNSWNDGAARVLNTTYRLHGVWNGATNKRLYVDGVLGPTDSTISAVGGTSDSFTIGDNSGNGSFHRGNIGYVYLRHTVLSADWIAAEFSNINAPSSFYSVSQV